MSSGRFKTPLAQKVYFHQYLDKLPFGALHVIDTKYHHSKRLITKHKVHQMGYDFNLPSTTYLKNTKVRAADVIWLDYYARTTLCHQRPTAMYLEMGIRNVQPQGVQVEVPDQVCRPRNALQSRMDGSHLAHDRRRIPQGYPTTQAPQPRWTVVQVQV